MPAKLTALGARRDRLTAIERRLARIERCIKALDYPQGFRGVLAEIGALNGLMAALLRAVQKPGVKHE